jgi:stress-induced-phosphoprotein 1
MAKAGSFPNPRRRGHDPLRILRASEFETGPDVQAASSMASEWKAKGNAALSAGNAQEAVACYTKAIELDPSDHVFYSNRSAAYLSMDDAAHALEDAEACIKTKADWAKGHARKGAALHALKRYDEAVAAYDEGLKVEPGNAACANGAADAKRDQAQAQAQAQAAFNPFANAFGPDMFAKIATNPRLSPMLSDPEFVQKLQEIQRDPAKINVHLQDPRVMTVLGELMGLNVNMDGPEDTDEQPPAAAQHEPARPKTPEAKPMDEGLSEEEQAERAAKKAAEDAKQRGNALYKQKKFSEAIECYKEAIEKDATNMSYLSNLAAVRLEMGAYDACIDDCKYVSLR